MKSHSGVVIIDNCESSILNVTDQMMVIRSSTEAKFVTLPDAISIAVYHPQPLNAQGYEVVASVMRNEKFIIHVNKDGRFIND